MGISQDSNINQILKLQLRIKSGTLFSKGGGPLEGLLLTRTSGIWKAYDVVCVIKRSGC